LLSSIKEYIYGLIADKYQSLNTQVKFKKINIFVRKHRWSAPTMARQVAQKFSWEFELL
jgi:hypothetical protein